MHRRSMDLINVMNSMEKMNPLETANELTRLALEKHLMFNKPSEALQLHIFAIDMHVLEGTRLLNGEAETSKKDENTIVSAIIITLIDIGNCFWSSLQPRISKFAYDSAKLMYNLMKIKSPLIESSISNRLSKLEVVISSKCLMNMNTCQDQNVEDAKSFEGCINITKSTVEQLSVAMFEQT